MTRVRLLALIVSGVVLSAGAALGGCGSDDSGLFGIETDAGVPSNEGGGSPDTSTDPGADAASTDAGADVQTEADAADASDGATVATYSVGGTVTGIAGAGLVLQDNAGDNLTLSANGSFVFKTRLASGATFAVTILTQPTAPAQVCTVSGATGTVAKNDITSVTVNCAAGQYTVGGTASGLAGTAVLQNNGGNNLSVTANGSFAFGATLANGQPYAVTVLTQPTGQLCTVTNGSGNIAGANVANVGLACVAETYSVGGTVTGMTGAGLVVQNNAGDNLTIATNGSFVFKTRIASGATFAVTILTQPTAPAQTCTVSGGTGTVAKNDITSVTVSCATDQYTVGGTASGLVGTAVLQNNGGDDLSVTANGSFAFGSTLANGQPYAVTVVTQPAGQLCTVTNGSGNIAGANVANVGLSCVAVTYSVGGSLTGLAGGGSLKLQNNGADTLTLNANGSFQMPTKVPSGSSYNITVSMQPAGQTCVVSGGSGKVGAADVTSVVVNCAAGSYTIGGTVSGLAGTVVLQNNGGDDLSLTANGGFAFATPLATGSAYAVTILTQPTGQTCVLANASGTIAMANITNVSVTCTTNKYTIGGTISGLTGTVILQNNGGDNLSRNANGTFTFSTSVPYKGSYNVTVLTQPNGQVCKVTNGSGIVDTANVTDIVVTCEDKHTIGGTVAGLAGSPVVLQNNGADNLTVNVSGSFTFATPLAQGATYKVTILTQPANRTCTVANGMGVVGTTNVTTVGVACVP